MNYVVLEVINGEITLFTNEDGKSTMIFEDLDEAKDMAEVCSNSIVVPLHEGLMDLIAEAAAFIDVATFEFEEDLDVESLPERFQELLG